MIYRRVTNAHGRIDIVLGQKLAGQMAIIDRKTMASEFWLQKKGLNQARRRAFAAQLLDLRAELRKFIEDKNA